MHALHRKWDEARAEVLNRKHVRQTTLNRARQQTSDLELRFLSVNPANRLVAQDLESKLEAAKREVDRLERLAEPAAPEMRIFSEERFSELERLSSDVTKVFSAATTADRDRKELLRSVISAVVVESRSPEAIRARIRWQSARPDTPIEARLFRAAYPEIARLAAHGIPYGEIAKHLNGMGLRTLQHRGWSAPAVGAAVRSQRRALPPKKSNARIARRLASMAP